MIPLNLIQPIIGTTINTVIAIENLFNTDKSIDKKKKAMKDAAASMYKILDGVFNLDDNIDAWAIILIDKSIDSTVDFFNSKLAGNFEEKHKDGAFSFVTASLKEQGLLDA